MFYNSNAHTLLYSSEEAALIQRDLEYLDCIFGESDLRLSLWNQFDWLIDDGEVSLSSFELDVLLVSLKICSSVFHSDEVRESLIKRLVAYIEDD